MASLRHVLGEKRRMASYRTRPSKGMERASVCDNGGKSAQLLLRLALLCEQVRASAELLAQDERDLTAGGRQSFGVAVAAAADAAERAGVSEHRTAGSRRTAPHRRRPTKVERWRSCCCGWRCCASERRAAGSVHAHKTSQTMRAASSGPACAASKTTGKASEAMTRIQGRLGRGYRRGG